MCTTHKSLFAAGPVTTAISNMEDIISSLDKIDLESLSDEAAVGPQLIAAARRMIARLEPPFTQVWNTAVVPVHVTVAYKILSDIGLWEAWRAADGKEATLMELWEMCKVPCDSVLLREIRSDQVYLRDSMIANGMSQVVFSCPLLLAIFSSRLGKIAGVLHLPRWLWEIKKVQRTTA